MNIMENISCYSTFIFDFDGVILDSNNIKKHAIKESVKTVLSVEGAQEFVKYFVELNGVPREVKIKKYIDEKYYNFVLNKYEKIINCELEDAQLIPGVRRVLQFIYGLNKKMIVLSGGTQVEVRQLLAKRGLLDYFDGVYGGPRDKEENLRQLSLTLPVLYFGDSEVDYLVAKKNGFDFVFVYGASNINDWKNKTKDWSIMKSICDFR